MNPANDEELGVQVKVTEWLTGEVPDPVSEMTSGELPALLLTVTLLGRLPVVEGSKVTLKEVDCPAARVRGTVKPVALNPVPLTLIFDTDTLELPVFVSVTLWVALVPVARLPKLSEAGVGVSCRVEETPVPARGTTSGELGVLFTSVRLA